MGYFDDVRGNTSYKLSSGLFLTTCYQAIPKSNARSRRGRILRFSNPLVQAEIELYTTFSWEKINYDLSYLLDLVERICHTLGQT